MTSKVAISDQQVDINFESHPPIEDDINGVAALLRQSLLQFVDCHSLASYLISLKETTQVIAQEAPEEENVSEDDEPDDDIYGVVSVIDLSASKEANKEVKSEQVDAKKKLLKFLKEKCPKLKESLDDDSAIKYGMIVNERYINLPPQLALPTFKALTQNLESSKFTHLIFVSKILMKARNTDTKLPSKKLKTSEQPSASTNLAQDEQLVFVNPEEEIIFEKCDYHSDLDVSAHCDENATWSFSSDVKYIPHRRICVVDYKKWPEIIKSLEKELS